MNGIKVKIGTYEKLGEEAAKLRRSVFIDEQGAPEDEVFDDLNDCSLHCLMYDDEVLVASTRLFHNGSSWRIGLVAVDRSMRDQHFGKEIMQASIDYISSHGGREILLSAQLPAMGFYEKLGFEKSGKPEIFESGFVLVPMRLVL